MYNFATFGLCENGSAMTILSRQFRKDLKSVSLTKLTSFYKLLSNSFTHYNASKIFSNSSSFSILSKILEYFNISKVCSSEYTHFNFGLNKIRYMDFIWRLPAYSLHSSTLIKQNKSLTTRIKFRVANSSYKLSFKISKILLKPFKYLSIQYYVVS